MKAMRLVDGNDDQGSLLIPDDLPEPHPGPSELLIRVFAAGVIPTELTWYPTTHHADGQPRRRAVPCHEFSGIVAQTGKDAGDFTVGQQVFGMNDWYTDGALAEFCTAASTSVAPKPKTLTHAEAASVPISALTAWQGLFDRAHLQPGETILVHGGAGSVGVFVIQLARLHGAHVIATASAANREFVSELGADQVIDYHQVRFEEAIDPVDVVFDTVGGETLNRSWAVLKPDGRLVTVASGAEASGDERVTKAFFIVEPIQKELASVADLIDTGKLRTIVDSVVPLSQAPDAFNGKLMRQRKGKVVIAVQDVQFKT
jgi:NADPH:quinone reductase-like Zn-dependent oxidoreductase